MNLFVAVCSKLLMIALLWFLPGAEGAEAAPTGLVPLPEPLGYMTDHAHVVDVEWKERIRSVCQDLERKTGVELVLVTVPSLKPFGSANDYATALYERWGIGTAQEEHGVLVLLAVQDHQAAITVGRRMLPVITHQVRSKIGSEYLDPALKTGHFEEGLYRTAVALASASQNIRAGNLTKYHYKAVGLWITLITSISAVGFLWWISRPDLRHPYARIRRGEYWGSGQGGFGGNFGGFGGGTNGEGLR